MRRTRSRVRPRDRRPLRRQTDAGNGDRLCKRHNLVKELDGWRVKVQPTGLDGTGSHGICITTPTGRVHDSTAPPILGEGWAAPEPDDWISECGDVFTHWVEHAHEGHYWAA